MSQQFVFWRTTESLDSRFVYEELMSGRSVDGLESLDLASAEHSLLTAFPEWNVEIQRSSDAEQTMLNQGDGGGALDVEYTSQSVTVTCYGMAEDGWNAVIDAMNGVGLPLYDPQVNQRFQLGPTPKV